MARSIHPVRHVLYLMHIIHATLTEVYPAGTSYPMAEQ